MPNDRKNGAGKAGDAGPVKDTADDNEALGEGLLKAGFKPAIGRKIVSQGKRRETLKKRPSKCPD